MLPIPNMRSSFLRNVATLGTGTLVAQAIPILASVLLTRLYEPVAFGGLGFFLSMIAILGVLANGKYEFAILLPERDEDAFHIVCLCVSLIAVSASALLILFMFFQDVLGRLFHVSWTGMLPLIAVGVFLAGLFRTLNLWFNRKTRYRVMAVSRMLQTGGTAVSAIILGMGGWMKGGLILGVLVGYGMAAGFLLLMFVIEDARYLRGIRVNAVLAQARGHADFPRFMILSSFMEITAIQLPLLLFPTLFGPVAAGYFALSHRVTRAPLGLIVRAVGDVFRQRASRAFASTEGCSRLFRTTAFTLTAMAIPLFVTLCIVSPSLFAFVFGESWRAAGEYTRILAFAYGLQFVANPLSSLFQIAGKQKNDLHLQASYLGGVGAALWIGFALHSVYLAVALLAAAACLKYVIQLRLSHLYSRQGSGATGSGLCLRSSL